MKRMMLCAMMMMILWVTASAEDNVLIPALDPESGKCGYQDAQGVFVIAPQFDSVSAFRGDYAVVSVSKPRSGQDADRLFKDEDGIIDREGRFVLAPDYYITAGYDGMFFGGKDTGIWYITQYEHDVWGTDENGEEVLLSGALDGFFDIPSGMFSGLKWAGIWPWVSDSRLIPVIDENLLAGYADRTTGELVIPYRYFAVDPGNFYGGVAAVAYENEDGDPEDFFLINEAGAEIPLPAGIHAVQYEGAFDGRVKIQNDDHLFGYADTNGSVVIEPQFIFANSFENGLAVVQFPEEDWGLVTTEGTVTVRGLKSDDWRGPQFTDGLYTLQTGKDTFSLVNMQGQTIMTLTMKDLVKLYTPNEEGLCRFETDTSGKSNFYQQRKVGYVNLAGEIIVPAEPD